MLRSVVDFFYPDPMADVARIAVVDVGSNSVRMVVFSADTRVPAVLFNEKALCGLGAELEATGRLSESGKDLAMRALSRFADLAQKMGVRQVIAIGTAALRDADDGRAFAEQAEAATGLRIEIASGADEARLAAQGVLLGDPRAKGLVADLGGASLELVEINSAAARPTGAGVTTPLGALRVLSQLESRGRSDVIKRIDAEIETARGGLGAAASRPETLYALGGSFRAFAGAWMELRGYPLRVLQGYSLPYDEALEAAEWLSKVKPPQIRQISGVSEQRAAVTPAACLTLWRLVRQVKPKTISISAFGLREGAYWERLSPELAAADPLLDAVAHIEARQARTPGFGAELFAWLAPVLTAFSTEELRLAQAACALSDAGWRTHPDYRAMTVLELVTRNAFGGVDHKGRAFISAALLYRYKGGRKAAKMEPAFHLLSEDRRARAEALGRGMRLGATISGATMGVLPALRLAADGERLSLRAPTGDALVGGEEVSKRFATFAAALNLTPDLRR